MSEDDQSALDGIRIAHVTSVPFFLVTQLKGQMTYLHACGMDVTMVTSQGDELRQLEPKTGLEHVVIEIRRRPAPWHDFMALLQMVRLFRAKRFQIVHSTTPKAGLLTAVASALARVPVRLHTFTGQPWVTMKGVLRWISRSSDRMICSLNTHVYADSPSQRRYLIDEGIVDAEHIDVIGAGSLAGVDVQRFSRNRFSSADRARIRRDLGISSQARIVAFIGRVTREKGIDELLEAVCILRREGQAVELLLIGPSDEVVETGRGGKGEKLGCVLEEGAPVHRVGYTDAPEAYLSIADVLCLPSYREGFGTVVIEAAAMGVPAVGTAITGLSDAVVDEVTGLLVPPRNVSALAVALRRLITDDALRSRLSENARERCKAQFDAQVVNRQLAGEYARLLRTAPRSMNG